MPQEKGCMVIPFFRSSTKAYAVSYGLIQGGGWGYAPYVDVLKKIYPGQLFYHKWAKMVHDFYQMIPLPVAYAYLQEHARCVVLYGQTMEMDRNQFDVSVLDESGYDGGEGLFLIKGIR